MARKTPFSVGQRWYCKRVADKYDRPNFTFIIIGPGRNRNEKLCRIESDDPENDSLHNVEQEYSHAHLKKCATLVVVEEKPKGEYYVDYDEDSASYCVFHTEEAKAFSSWSDEGAAQRDADKRNGKEV